MSLVSELRRRQVFRAAAWYGGLAWFAIQVADTVVPRFDLPDWTVRAVILAALLGLPVVLVLAWFFDLTPGRVRRESKPAGDAAATTVWRIPSFWIALVLGIGLTVSGQQAWQRLVRPATEDRPSVAVLPFANLSPDPENAFFADGLQEEILATLARAGGLRVISRTSVQEYRDPKRNLREIADALGASYVLEGSVRRAGDEIRLTLQLIDGRKDEHVWAQTYDRKFRDALHLQRTVAQQVAAEIGAKLSPAEERLLAAVVPTVPEAYEPYVHALALWNQHAPEADLRAVESLLDESLAHDPDFALAYALRSKARIWLAYNYLDNDAAMTEAARSDFERALKLQPELPEALTARGLYHTYVARDPERAIEDLTRALAIAPNDPDSLNSAGLTLRRLGRHDEALESFREAARLSPGQERYAYRYFETLLGLGRLDEAEQERRRFLRQFPDHPGAMLVRYWIRFLQTGETAGWRDDYERLAPLLGNNNASAQAMRVMYATNDLAALQPVLEKLDEAEPDPSERAYDLGLLYAELGDDRLARPNLEAVAAEARSRPDDALALAVGAVALALLGQHDEALRVADLALQQAPPKTKDALNYTRIASLHAWVLVKTRARAEQGYAELEGLAGSYGMVPQEMLVLPPWRLLRDDPRVEQIIRSRTPR